MGKKLDALLGRSSKTAKLRMLANLAISRIAILRNLHSVRCSQAQSDVIQLLQQGDQERALLRAEYVIKEQNTLDAFVLMGNYCRLLGERSEVIKNSRECPDELKEAVSSLIFAASRFGGFPELQEIRHMLTSKYGKQFAASAVELRNNCGVYPKMIQRLSTKQASLETRQNLLNQIAEDNGITLQPHHQALDVSSKLQEQLQMHASGETFEARKMNVNPLENQFPEAEIGDAPLSESVKAWKAYRDVAAAAQDAFESAAYAAAAARAAVELSRLEDSDGHGGSHHQHSGCNSSPIYATQTGRDAAPEEVNSAALEFNLATIHPDDSTSSGSDSEGITENRERFHLKRDVRVGLEEKSLDSYNLNKLGSEVNEIDDEIRKTEDRRAHIRYYQNRSNLHRNAPPQHQIERTR